MGALFSGLFSSASSIFGTAKYWLIAIAVTAVASGALGYYKGSDHVTKEYINASTAQIASATTAGAKAQADKDARDYAANQADSAQRQTADQKRIAALEALLKNASVLVPKQPKDCPPVSAAAMGKLNDPDLVGATP